MTKLALEALAPVSGVDLAFCLFSRTWFPPEPGPPEQTRDAVQPKPGRCVGAHNTSFQSDFAQQGSPAFINEYEPPTLPLMDARLPKHCTPAQSDRRTGHNVR